MVKIFKKQRLRKLQRLIETLPDGEIAVYEDEVDVHRNPKQGPD